MFFVCTAVVACGGLDESVTTFFNVLEYILDPIGSRRVCIVTISFSNGYRGCFLSVQLLLHRKSDACHGGRGIGHLMRFRVERQAHSA